MSTLRRRLRAFLLEPLLRGLAWLLGRLSWSGVQRCGRGVGRLGWQVSRRERRRCQEHLALALPELDPGERERLARAVFRHQGTNLIECLALLTKSCEQVTRLVEVEGWNEVETARAAGRPILILTGHCGNWELLAALINCRGLGMEVVARGVESHRLNRLLLALRQRFGTATIERSAPGSARRLLKVLRDGRALGMLIDQDTAVDGVWVPFFGRPAFTPVGAAKIALKQSAAVLPAFIERLPGGRHRVRFHPPLDLPADATEATALMTRAIEVQIRRRPEQWVWMHRRWRRQPPDLDPG